jgi:hypothetical protein
MANRAEYPHVQRVESNLPANLAETGKFDRKFESSALSASTGSRQPGSVCKRMLMRYAHQIAYRALWRH